MRYVATAAVVLLVLVFLTMRSEPRTPTTEAQRLEAVRRGQAFLVSALQGDQTTLSCEEDGRVVERLDGYGRVFAIHFMALALRGEIDASLAGRVAGRMRRVGRDGLWGYAPSAPLDSDDSAFGLRLLEALGRPEEDSAYEQLERFAPAAGDGLYRTFDEAGPSTLTTEVSIPHNAAIHPEVNANILHLLARRGRDVRAPVRRLVEEAVAADGSVPSYFYPSPYYAPMWLASLMGRDEQLPEPLRRMLRRIARDQNADGSWGADENPYDTALALCALAAGPGDRQVRERGIDYLVRRQRADGSWSADTVIWEFLRSANPRRLWRARDPHRVVTSSLVVLALRGCRELNSRGHR